MKKLGTKVRRVVVLSTMMVFMTCTNVFAIADWRTLMDCELTLNSVNGYKDCFAQTVANKSSYPFSYLDVEKYYYDGEERDYYKERYGVGVAAIYTCGYEDIDCVVSNHYVKNSDRIEGDRVRFSQ
ncbi:MAG: hypothetical protein ACI4E1_11945 [Lachnospira sp.]